MRLGDGDLKRHLERHLVEAVHHLVQLYAIGPSIAILSSATLMMSTHAFSIVRGLKPDMSRTLGIFDVFVCSRVENSA